MTYHPNIYSGSTDEKGLCAALTNPTIRSRRVGTITRDYPLTVNGITYPDLETYYQKFSVRNQTAENDQMMIRILVIKFTAYPFLADAITRRGGVRWLETCQHDCRAKTARFQAWQGIGRESRFIRNLIGGYEKYMAGIASCT